MKFSQLARYAGLVLLLLPGRVFADARIEARRHFRNGMAFIERGAYDEGIAELRTAYAMRAHPNVLYNIARAYQESGRPAEALEYFRRYLVTEPTDVLAVKTIVARLEAALPPPRPAKAPEEKKPDTAKHAGDEETLRKMNSLLSRLESAVEKAESSPVKTESQPAPTLVAEQETDEDSGRPYEERIVTASRHSQSTLESPYATTVITGDEIRLSGANSLVELLRRVPGAEVMMLGVGSANVSFRGFNQRLANKVLVLVDGRTEYQDFLGLTLWAGLPVGLEEIDRIEVIRGPGSALYGANAMLGVINIISKAPGFGPRAEFNVYGGSGNTAGGSFLSSLTEKSLQYRVSVGYEQANKWSRDFASDRPDIASNVTNSNLGLRSARGNVTALYNISRDVHLTASGGVNRFFTEIYPLGILRNYYFDGISSNVKTDLGIGPVKVMLFWNHTDANAGPQYEPLSQRSLRTTVNANVYDAEAVYSQSFELVGEHRLGVGASTRLKQVSWEYIDRPRSELHAAAFIQDEWKIIEPLRIVASYRIDRHPLLDNGNPGYAQSPRLTAIWFPAEGHAIRASAATAFREPTFLESYTSVRVPLPGVNGASALTVGNQSLRPEKLIAFEVGYRGDAPRLGLEWDIALYQNSIKDLIGLSAISRLPVGQSFDQQTQTFLVGRTIFQNELATYTARGIELGTKYSPLDGFDLRLATAYQQVVASIAADSGACGPCSQAPRFKLYGGASYRASPGIDIGVDAAFSTSTTWIEREPSTSDPTRIQVAPYGLPAYTIVNAKVSYRVVPNRVSVSLVGTNLGPSHLEHPFGNLIERRVFAVLSVTP